MLVGLGQAYELKIKHTPDSPTRTVTFPSEWWWAWVGTPSSGNIALVRVLPGVKDARGVSSEAIRIHERFHNVRPSQLLHIERPSNKPPIRHAGRVVAFAYNATSFSSSKGDAPYRHYFGAFTHEERPPFNESFWPDLVVDADGGFTIRRRSGNTFRLDEWVIG